MSGHSRWSQIKHKKSAADAKRSQLFAKLSREIEAAARGLGADPNANPRLASLIAEARKVQFPKEKIEAVLSRTRGQAEGEKDLFWTEAYGPEGIALIIGIYQRGKEATLQKIKQILAASGGKLANPGEVRWQFKEDLAPLRSITPSPDAKIKAQECIAGLKALDGISRIVHNAAL